MGSFRELYNGVDLQSGSKLRMVVTECRGDWKYQQESWIYSCSNKLLLCGRPNWSFGGAGYERMHSEVNLWIGATPCFAHNPGGISYESLLQMQQHLSHVHGGQGHMISPANLAAKPRLDVLRDFLSSSLKPGLRCSLTHILTPALSCMAFHVVLCI